MAWNVKETMSMARGVRQLVGVLSYQLLPVDRPFMFAGVVL